MSFFLFYITACHRFPVYYCSFRFTVYYCSSPLSCILLHVTAFLYFTARYRFPVFYCTLPLSGLVSLQSKELSFFLLLPPQWLFSFPHSQQYGQPMHFCPFFFARNMQYKATPTEITMTAAIIIFCIFSPYLFKFFRDSDFPYTV